MIQTFWRRFLFPSEKKKKAEKKPHKKKRKDHFQAAVCVKHDSRGVFFDIIPTVVYPTQVKKKKKVVTFQ